jgi:hypothetical protein
LFIFTTAAAAAAASAFAGNATATAAFGRWTTMGTVVCDDAATATATGDGDGGLKLLNDCCSARICASNGVAENAIVAGGDDGLLIDCCNARISASVSAMDAYCAASDGSTDTAAEDVDDDAAASAT